MRDIRRLIERATAQDYALLASGLAVLGLLWLHAMNARAEAPVERNPVCCTVVGAL